MKWNQDLEGEFSNRHVCSLPWDAFELTDNVLIEYVIHESVRPGMPSLWRAEIRTISEYGGIRTRTGLSCKNVSTLDDAKSLCEDHLRDLASGILSKIEGKGWCRATHDYNHNL